ncbi:MAG: gamma-glutamylcyclotransferase [Bdellovibrionales bacterium]|nr:gamma-glutamylcyclotransferase [Bdellovibrionales bacterium]
MGKNIFAYGTLIFHDVVEAVCGYIPAHSPATLKNFARYVFLDEMYPGVVESQGDSVSGTVYRDVPEEVVDRLDVFEGEMYLRVERRVELPSKEELLAQVYVIPFSRRELLAKRDWSPEEFERNSLDEFVSFSRQWMKDHL